MGNELICIIENYLMKYSLHKFSFNDLMGTKKLLYKARKNLIKIFVYF